MGKTKIHSDIRASKPLVFDRKGTTTVPDWYQAIRHYDGEEYDDLADHRDRKIKMPELKYEMDTAEEYEEKCEDRSYASVILKGIKQRVNEEYAKQCSNGKANWTEKKAGSISSMKAILMDEGIEFESAQKDESI
jgi:hypothetical protein